MCLDLLEAYLTELCLCVFRKDVFQLVRAQIKPKCLESALAGEVPLSWASLNHVLCDEAKPLQLALGNRVAVKDPSTIVSWLWGWRDGEFERRGWDDLPYRMLAKQSFGLIVRVRGKAHARVWRAQLRTTFMQGHWLLPYPYDRGFMRKGKDGSVLWWSVINESLNRYYRKFYKDVVMPRVLLCIPKGSKITPRADIGWLVGYVASNMWKVWLPEQHRIVTSRDIIFDETSSGNTIPQPFG